MKKIKPIVLKDATKLTNSQMKKIRGGVAVEGRPTKCSMQCDIGAYEPEIEVECRDWISNATHCETSATIGIMCYTPDGVAHTVRSCMYPRNK